MSRAYAPTDPLRLSVLDINSDGRRPALLICEEANGRGVSTVTKSDRTPTRPRPSTSRRS